MGALISNSETRVSPSSRAIIMFYFDAPRSIVNRIGASVHELSQPAQINTGRVVNVGVCMDTPAQANELFSGPCVGMGVARFSSRDGI